MARIINGRGGCLRAAGFTDGTGVSYAQGSGNGCYPYYCGSCPGTAPVNGCPGGCRDSNGWPAGGWWPLRPGGPGYPGGPGFPGWPGGNVDEFSANSTGFFTQQGSLSLAAGGIVPFNGVDLTRDMSEMAGRIRLDRGGTYLALYNVELPAEQPAAEAAETAACCLQLTLNGVSVPGGDIHLGTGTEYTASRSGQAVFQAMPGSVVSLVSNGSLDVTAEQSSDTLVSLSLMRLG